jgi:DNA-binding NarL/FixJ family response regulator
MLSIAIIDDDPELVELLRDFLAADPRFAPLQAFDSGAPALEAARKGKFSVVLDDIRLLNDSGLRWIRRIREACPGMRILAYTCVDSEETVITAIEAGADGYLLKQASFTEIVASILEAVKGLPVASGVVLRALFRLVRKDFVSSQHHDLSPAELRILELSAKGYDCKTVAKKLGISVQTVYVHNRRIFRKLGVTNRLAAIAKLQEKDPGLAFSPKIAAVSG